MFNKHLVRVAGFEPAKLHVIHVHGLFRIGWIGVKRELEVLIHGHEDVTRGGSGGGTTVPVWWRWPRLGVRLGHAWARQAGKRRTIG